MHRVVFWLNNSKKLRIIEIAGVLLLPVLLFIVPLEWVKEQDSICLYKFLTGHECIGCGMTRAVLSFLHFQFEDALRFNKLVVIVFPLLIYIWLRTLFNFSKNTLTEIL
jgi:hypothetical protein